MAIATEVKSAIWRGTPGFQFTSLLPEDNRFVFYFPLELVVICSIGVQTSQAKVMINLQGIT